MKVVVKTDEPRSRGGAAAVAALLLIVAVVGYPLSLGPVACLVENTGLSNQTDSALIRGLETFYAPALWVLDKETPVQTAYLKYLNLWVPETITSGPPAVPPSAPLPYVPPPPLPTDGTIDQGLQIEPADPMPSPE